MKQHEDHKHKHKTKCLSVEDQKNYGVPVFWNIMNSLKMKYLYKWHTQKMSTIYSKLQNYMWFDPFMYACIFIHVKQLSVKFFNFQIHTFVKFNLKIYAWITFTQKRNTEGA